MAALKLQQDPSGKFTLRSSPVSGMGNILSVILWIGVIAIFFLPVLNGEQIDWGNLLFVLVFGIATIGGTLIGALVRTTVTLDPMKRTITSSRSILTFPVQTDELRFSEIESIANEYYRQQSGRYSHDAWRVAAVANDGRRLAVNWDGKKDEMASLAQKLSALTGAQVIDSSEKQVSTVQQIFDRMRGQLPEEASTTSMPDTAPLPNTIQNKEQGQPPVEQEYVPMVDHQGAEAIPPPRESPLSTSIWSLSAEELEKRIASDQLDSDGRFALARKYYARGQPDRAIELYQKAIQLDPANANIQNDMGVALERRGRRAEAEVAYRRAVALDPFSTIAHLNLGLLLRSMNRASEASQEFFQARQNARGDAETRRAEDASKGAKLDPQLSSIS